MTLGELLTGIGQRLAEAGIPYMVTGSVASSFHGTPRATRDVDIVIDPTASALESFVLSLPADAFYVDLDAALASLAERSQFNVVENAGGWKVDLMIRKDRPFSVEEFSRRQAAELLGTSTFVASAEDLVIAKLEWAKAAGSERQLRDVAGILAANGELDVSYIERWVAALDLGELWSQVLTPGGGAG